MKLVGRKFEEFTPEARDLALASARRSAHVAETYDV